MALHSIGSQSAVDDQTEDASAVYNQEVSPGVAV